MRPSLIFDSIRVSLGQKLPGKFWARIDCFGPRELAGARAVAAAPPLFQNFQYRGTTTTVTISAQAMTTRPSFQKSPNRYPPGPYTIKLTPCAKGVRKEALAPMATPNIRG